MNAIKSISYTIYNAAGIEGNDIDVVTTNREVIKAIAYECDLSDIEKGKRPNFIPSLNIKIDEVEFAR